ncbi:hypothetical protein PO878_14040 [Iamia majanohamensis]|uniref:Uncharacterized protein n=1 Tax=Iamia majanohamensis TaxID=467976 RepID=A0AAE9YD54_9ACTN|nr:hypothetical protein [Iamia majanohamensis]WCO65621.1 hypothetical protein PO878_14040 [Iamia majanohamensis]
MVDVAPGLPPLTLVDDPSSEVDLDTGGSDGAEVAALVAAARIDGAATVRTGDPRAAHRAATVIDAIVAAGARDRERAT